MLDNIDTYEKRDAEVARLKAEQRTWLRGRDITSRSMVRYYDRLVQQAYIEFAKGSQQ